MGGKPEKMTSIIPQIDMQNFPAESKRLVEACEEWGCFRIVSQNIPLELMSRMNWVTKSLFHLPLRVKERFVGLIPGREYVEPTKINARLEALGMYDAGSSEAVNNFCDQ